MDTDNLELKKRSRRRLVGAAALALLAAILLPMVMDQEPRSPSQDIQITIPDRDAELSRPIAGRAPVNVEPDVAPPPQEQPPAAAAAPTAPELAAPPAATPSPAPAPASKPPATAAAPQRAPAQAATPAKPPQDEAARVRAILEGKVPPPSTAGDGFVVQVAAFGEVAKAEALARELKGKGFAAYTEKAGNVTRVRVGPFPARAEADRAAERLRAQGQTPVVTAR
ncbi:SPOR domain-containing protein [Pseudothauera rhizosphaerae]|uniref:SPOR domain-containing protein n=1 Tax=Pseudothauera rhizosphaerae TaxID=2565932 RepID=A0A4S4AS10_9RHOO|nr:SPOR domain-containing protein [Pseudothauera rhizosphaerae]THF62488.1 SPOR domain-containing protein [Pseudothauera rhizosphaerae]